MGWNYRSAIFKKKKNTDVEYGVFCQIPVAN